MQTAVFCENKDLRLHGFSVILVMKRLRHADCVRPAAGKASNANMSYEEILEASLPNYLKKDIDALKEGCETNSSVLDCLYNEVQGSINSAYYDNEITEEQAVFLRKKYLFMED